MSSFHKKSDSQYSIKGTKLKNNLPFVSSGIPSLDHIIGKCIIGPKLCSIVDCMRFISFKE